MLPLSLPYLFFLLTPAPPTSPLFPYTTLFRSALVSGITVGSLFDQQKVFDVVVWGSPAIRSSLSRSEEHTSELQSRVDLVCRLLLEKKKKPPATRGVHSIYRVRFMVLTCRGVR